MSCNTATEVTTVYAISHWPRSDGRSHLWGTGVQRTRPTKYSGHDDRDFEKQK